MVPTHQFTSAAERAVPTYPTKLPGELWGIAAYYNPAGYSSRRCNLRIFSDRVRRQGLKLIIVELAFDHSPFELSDQVCDRLIQLRTPSVLWQKERLLNIGLAHLPRQCDKVAWLDADIIFENQDWIHEASTLLESYVIVQPFETACWLPKLVKETEQSASPVVTETQSSPGMANVMANAVDKKGVLSKSTQHGHCGFAWSARREVLERHGFYDCYVFGGGDDAIAHAMYGDCRYCEAGRFSAALVRHINTWAREFFSEVRGSVFYTPGRVLHLWHGSYENREYEGRHGILKDHDFDPVTDLAEEPNGCWGWRNDKTGLHESAINYFRLRREDD